MILKPKNTDNYERNEWMVKWDAANVGEWDSCAKLCDCVEFEISRECTKSNQWMK